MVNLYLALQLHPQNTFLCVSTISQPPCFQVCLLQALYKVTCLIFYNTYLVIFLSTLKCQSFSIWIKFKLFLSKMQGTYDFASAYFSIHIYNHFLLH